MKNKFIIKILILLFFLISCDEKTEINDNKIDIKNNFSQVFGLPDSINPNSLFATIKIGSYKYWDTENNKWWICKNADAYFVNSASSVSIDAGYVIINTDTLHKSSSFQNGLNSFSYEKNINFLFQGQMMNFNVTGSSAFPNMNFNVISPTQELQITAPVQNSSISKNNDLVINWTSDNNIQNKVMISLIGNSGWGTTIITDDTGSHTLYSYQLQQLAAGDLKIQIMCGKFELKEVPNTDGRYAMALVHSTQIIDLTVQ